VSGPLIAWELDVRTRRFLRVSGEAETVLGYPEQRWREAPGFWIGVLHPDDRERVARAVWRVVREGGSCEIEYRVVAADGTVVRLRDRVRVVADSAGAASVLQGATVSVVPDLTSPLPVEAEPRPKRWRRSRRTNHLIAPPGPPLRPAIPFPAPAAAAEPSVFSPERMLDELGEAVMASDAAHRIVYWNSAAQTLLGWSFEEALGQADSELLQARTSAGQTAEIIAGLLGRRPWSAEATVRTRDGLSIPVRITASALRGADGAVAGFVAVITDLRAVREAASHREAMAAMDAVASLARGIAQELNEGVLRIESAIRNTLARVPLREPARGELDDALRTVDATAALAAQLTAMGRALAIKPAATDLAAVVHGSQAALWLLAGTDITVSTQLEAAPPLVWVDAAVASQILLNLAANATAAMPSGGRLEIATYAVDVARSAEEPPEVPAGPWVVLELRDTRADVPPTLARLFEPFSESVVPPGMGLAAAHGMVTLSGGRLTVQAGAEGGLVFRAHFRPAATVRGPASATDDPAPQID